MMNVRLLVDDNVSLDDALLCISAPVLGAGPFGQRCRDRLRHRIASSRGPLSLAPRTAVGERPGNFRAQGGDAEPRSALSNIGGLAP